MKALIQITARTAVLKKRFLRDTMYIGNV